MRINGVRALWISLAVGVVLLVVILVGTSLWTRKFLRSEEFRLLVSAKTGQALKSEAAYSPLRWAGSSLFADSLDAAGTPGSIVKNFRADQIRAEVNWRAAWDGAWRVDQVDVVNFEGTFRPGSPDSGAEPTQPTPAPSGLASLLPRRFELGQLNIARTRLGFQSAAGDERIALQESALQVRPDGSGWAIDGNGGSLKIATLPVLKIDNFRSRIQAPTFFLTNANLLLGDSGKIIAAGEFSENSKLRLEWSQLDVATFLDSAWKSRLSGLLAGTSVIEWPEAGLSAGKATGTFRLTDGLLQNLPALEQIATFTGAPQFRRMTLQELSGNYQWSVGQLTLTNLLVESKGLMRIEGNCAVAAGGALSGTVRVGVTPQTLQWLPGSRERVFTIAQSGYLWTEVRVGGTLQNPSEDLSPRLAAAVKDEVIDQGVRAIEKLPDGAREGAKGVLDILMPLIP